MSKKSNRGKGYFYAQGQRTLELYGYEQARAMRVCFQHWPQWAMDAYVCGYSSWEMLYNSPTTEQD